MKKAIRVFSIALVLTLTMVTAAGAITWGQPDDNEHPFVGTLLFVQNGVGFYSCTGTLIAPRVMLTAGHCVEEDGNINDLTYVRFDEDPVFDYYSPTIDWLEDKWLAVETVIPHPLYDSFADFPLTYDVGVVILAESYAPLDGGGNPIFGTLPDLGFLEGLRGADKNYFVSVGYGMQGTLPPFFQDDYLRYKGDVRMLELKSMLTGKGVASVKFSNNPGINGGTCYGDSGGPTFYKDTNMVVSVTSFGWAKNNNCVGNDFNYRMDTQDALDFVEGVLAEYGE
jgi:hypothetical protein